jgi:hypothetical protein
MFSYTAYGLGIHSSLPLPELEGAEARADLIIRFGKIDWKPAKDRYSVVEVSPSKMFFHWNDAGTFLAHRGREIVIDPLPDAEPEVLRLFTLGAVLAGVLHQRGLLLLHASAVEVGGSAVAFIGDKGWGKSTFAALMQERGHRLVTDDVVAIEVDKQRTIRVLPGFPQFKLWPDAVTEMGINPEDLPRVHPQLEKRAYRLRNDFSNASISLKAIYVLAEGERMEIESPRTQEAFVELVRHSYLARHLEATGATALHFQQCSTLIKAVPVFRLKRPRSLDLLPELASLVEQHLP